MEPVIPMITMIKLKKKINSYDAFTKESIVEVPVKTHFKMKLFWHRTRSMQGFI